MEVELLVYRDSLLQKAPTRKSESCAVYACEVALKYVVVALDSER